MASATLPLQVRGRPLRSLFVGPPPSPDRVFFHNVWFRGHNNPRHARLLPGLERLDPYLLTCSDVRAVRGVQFRALTAARPLRNRVLLARANRLYRFLFAVDLSQIPLFSGHVVVDHDDPNYTAEEARLLSLPNVSAYVVTTEGTARRFEELGVTTPCHVIPQGVLFSALDPERVKEVAARRRPGQTVIGYTASWFVTDRDQPGSPYITDHLFELWDQIRARLPDAVLWLVGEPSRLVRMRCEGRTDVMVTGRLSAGDVLAYVANFDVALYPRRVEYGPFAVKIAEYLGLGIPVVGYDLDVTQILTESGGGLRVAEPREFVDAVVQLSTDPARRAGLAARGSEAGRAFDWDRLLERYEREIFDVYLR